MVNNIVREAKIPRPAVFDYRATCLSCHQKRTLLSASHIAAEVRSPVAHRQVVLTIPKRSRCLRKVLSGSLKAWGGVSWFGDEMVGCLSVEQPFNLRRLDPCTVRDLLHPRELPRKVKDSSFRQLRLVNTGKNECQHEITERELRSGWI